MSLAAVFREILVGIYGRAGGRDAAVLARVLSEATGAEVSLAHAYPYEAFAGRGANRAFAAALRSETEELLERERETAGLPGARLVPVPDLHPARALHRLVEEDGADLLVVGSSHRGVLGRVLLGDAAASVLHAAPCAVAVAPHGFAAAPSARLERIGVGYDGSPAGENAARLAAELARAVGGRLRLITAVPATIPPEAASAAAYGALVDWPDYFEERRRAAQEGLSALTSRLGGEADAAVVEQAPGEALEAASQHLDLLVVASRKYGPVRRVLLGSTAHRLAHHAHCPLLVLPREEEDEDAAAAAA